ncbi:MAG: hypothetical protein COU07_01120 [Candidatus Harrisonbacteria bacterium CG10_big_fil_rev_8_21_14_0_10_40_38]|uniref:Type II secretion system protein GspG C-terminal domain-containing protein n=1 Tax=Candidatus Harrisonbacteria bacterium CG10_big_fil_rev_8_21_14_0_10_40_38 TaxID=1974583 RepID=A0A2H0UST9_9BACT|nr:MAG: hypothetical protein COU07_01120 [Candidatus Harrisonbacteria bacterium CG10_big_fil_rev_8_21_14_0_10_40_38]
MRFGKKTNRGFTLLELLLVLGVLVVLFLIVVLVINPQNFLAKGRDARRKQDLRQYEIALGLFYDKYGVYPCGDYAITYGSPSKIGALDGSGSLPFLDGRDEDNDPPTGGQGYETYCPDPPYKGIFTEGFLSSQPGKFYNDPLFDSMCTPGNVRDDSCGVYSYWYHLSFDRQRYVITARLEADDELMENDGGDCAYRFEVGNGLPNVDLDGSYPHDETVYSDGKNKTLEEQGQCVDRS